MNKKGGLLLAEETLKVVIAAICIIFLIVLIVAVYKAISGAKEKEQAEENLNRINDIILSLENGGEENSDIANPEGWHLISFVDEEKPNSCLNTCCLCICKGKTAEKCDKRGKGVCLVVENLANGKVSIEIKSPTFITLLKQDGKIFIGETL